MNKYQLEIKEFTEKRNWDQFHNPKDLLLGIVEEIGEIRNIVKWEQDRSKIQKALTNNKEKIKDDIGDIYWFLALLANGCSINIDEAISEVIKINKKRFPVKNTKSTHTNINIGGIDHKYKK